MQEVEIDRKEPSDGAAKEADKPKESPPDGIVSAASDTTTLPPREAKIDEVVTSLSPSCSP